MNTELIAITKQDISKTTIKQMLLIKTAISSKDADIVAEQVCNEISQLDTHVTSNLLKSIICDVLKENRLLNHYAEFIRNKKGGLHG